MDNNKTAVAPKMKSSKEHEPQGFGSLLALLLKLAAAFRVEMSEATQAVYLETLSTHPVSQVEQAVKRTIAEWDKPSLMPTLAFILARLVNSQLEAERAYEVLQTYLRSWWHPDIGSLSGAPLLDAATEYAVRQCGGLHRMYNADGSTFAFIRRDFLAAHQRFSVEGGEQLRLSSGEASRLLGSLKRGELPVECNENHGG
jgi:hypothetical protein